MIHAVRRVPVWVSSEVDGPDGLWQASAQGRVREGATKLLNKTAVWSPSKNTFELDLLEVRCFCATSKVPGINRMVVRWVVELAVFLFSPCARLVPR